MVLDDTQNSLPLRANPQVVIVVVQQAHAFSGCTRHFLPYGLGNRGMESLDRMFKVCYPDVSSAVLAEVLNEVGANQLEGVLGGRPPKNACRSSHPQRSVTILMEAVDCPSS